MDLKNEPKAKAHHARMPSNGDVGRFVFENKLLKHRKDFSHLSREFLRASLRARSNMGTHLTRDTKLFLELNLPLCFSHLELRVGIIQEMSAKLASDSEKILNARDGDRVFAWVLERAVSIAETDSSGEFANTLSQLFEACAKLGEMDHKIERDMFFSAFDGVAMPRAKQLLAEMSQAKSSSEIHLIISLAHSESQRLNLVNRGGHFAAEFNVHAKKA